MRINPAVLVIMVLVLSILAIGRASGIEDQVIADEEGDVIKTETVERVVDGYEEIDIISLESESDLTTVFITLTTAGDISTLMGYSYDINAGNLYIEYYDGELSIDSFSGETSAFADIVDNQIRITVPRTELEDSWFYLSAYTNYYDYLDFEEGSAATYSDEISEDPFGFDDDDTTRIMGSGTFEMELTDPEGDVVETTNMEAVATDRPDLDIISLSATENGDGSVIVELELLGAVSTDINVTYSIYMDDASIDYSGGHGSIFYYDGSKSSSSVSHTENVIRAVLDSSRIDSISYISAEAYFDDYTNGIMIYDEAGNSWFGDDLEGLFDVEMSIIIQFKSIDEIEIRMIMTFGQGNYSKMIRSEIDEDGDGTITEDEIEDMMEEGDPESMEPIDPDIVSMDGRSPDVVFDASYTDLLGPANSNASFGMETIMTLTFQLEESDNHTFTIGSPEEEEESQIGDMEYDAEETIDSLFPITLEIILPEGWDLDSVQPEELSTFAREGRIIIDGEDMESLDMDGSDVMSFSFVRNEDDEGGNDSGMEFILPVLGMILLLSILLFNEKRKRN